MCVIEQRTYIHPDGKKETFEHVKSRCDMFGPGKTCRQVTYEERIMQAAGHSSRPPRVRYIDDSSSLGSPASESFPPTPTNEATIVDVTPTSAGLTPSSSPKPIKSRRFGDLYIALGNSKRKDKSRLDKVKERYHGSSAASTTTSSSGERGYAVESPRPSLSAPFSGTSRIPTYQHSSRQTQSAATAPPTSPYTTATRAPLTRPIASPRDAYLNARGERDRVRSPVAGASPPRGPPGPPRPPAPPVPADPPSPDGSRRRKNRPNLAPIVTQPPRPSYSAGTRSPRPYVRSSRAPRDTPYTATSEYGRRRQEREERDDADAGSASVKPQRKAEEDGGARFARLERERFEEREKQRKQQKEDEWWADHYKERGSYREKERERKKKEADERESDDRKARFEEDRRRQQEESAKRERDDRWEAELEQGRRRQQQDAEDRRQQQEEDDRRRQREEEDGRRRQREEKREAEFKEGRRRQQEAAAKRQDDDDKDDDWEAKLQEGRRRLSELKQTDETSMEEPSPLPTTSPRTPVDRAYTTTTTRQYAPPRSPQIVDPPRTPTTTPRTTRFAERGASPPLRSSTTARFPRVTFAADVDADAAERQRLLDADEAQMAHERAASHKTLGAEIAAAEEEVRFYEERVRGREARDRQQRGTHLGSGGGGGGGGNEWRGLGRWRSRLPVAVFNERSGGGGTPLRETGRERGERVILENQNRLRGGRSWFP